MPNLLQKREKMAELATEARSELDKITDKTEPNQAKEIEARFDAIMVDHDALQSQVEREQKLADVEARQSKGDPRTPTGSDVTAPAEKRSDVAEYAEVFEKYIRNCDPNSDGLTMEERQVLRVGKSENRAQATAPGGAGGFTVPEGFSNEIDKAMAVWGPMWDAAVVRAYPTSTGNNIPWPTVDDTAARGRIKLENAAADDDGSDDVTFAQKVLSAYYYDTGIVRMSWEILQDSAFPMESLLAELFGERLGRTANDVLTTGTGTGQPEGILTGSALGKTAASGTAIAFDEIIDLQHSVDPAYRASPQARFQFNDDTLKIIRKLKDGQGNYLWQMGDVRTAEPNRILGSNYSINQAMPNIGLSAKPVIYGDHSRYIVRKVRTFDTMTLRERYAENFQVGMIGFKRFDGRLLNANSVKHLVMAAT